MASSPAGMAQTMLNTVVLVFTLMAGLVMFLRLFTRGLLIHKAGAEDAWIFLAMILSIGLTVTIALQVHNGLGKHIQELTPAMMTDSLKTFWASVWIYNLSLTATKMSILTQYLRVFPIPRFRVACYVVIGFVALYGIWTLLGSIFLCFPVAYFWDKTIADGRCLNQEAIWFSNATVNIVQDIVILILPIAVLKSLSITSRQKKVLIVVFGLGAVVCLVSIIRLQTLVSISNSMDPTFDNPPAAMLSAIETNVGIICACLPSMRPLLTSMMPVCFPEGSQYHNSSRFDVEQPKHMRYHSGSYRPYTADSVRKPSNSRSGGAASQGYKPSSPTSRSHSRSGSTGPIYTRTAPVRSQSTSSNRSRIGSRNGHSRTPSNSMDVPAETKLQSLSTSRIMSQPTHNNARQLDLSNGHEQPMNPLRMSPFSPVIPRLPRLPENMAVLGPLESQERPIRIPLFHKPLPITPLPGHQNAPQYLTKAQDQAMLPMMLSPGLMPEPLNLGVKSPAQSHLDRRSTHWA
ncbi:hypothetical protein PMIN04_008888 [Paraphaeosphaeria minitans]